MNYKQRLISARLAGMVARFPVVVVSGARQVGKSTLLRHALPEWDIVVFDSVVDVGNACEDPDLFLDNHPAPVILDEIQFAPELVAAIKRRLESDKRPGQYVLTGSQQWSVMKSASESLAGRAVFLDMEGFSLAESSEELTDTNWLRHYLDDPEAFVKNPGKRIVLSRTPYETLWRGFLPEADSLETDWISDFYRAYLRTYIERDVRMLSDVSDWQQFGRFVRLTASLTAQEVNHSQLGREVGVTPQTAQRWLGMLRATFQWFEAPAYHGNTIKRVSGKPKGYIADTGLACNLQMISTPQALSGHPLVGALFETAVVGEMRKLGATLSMPPTMYHWRSYSGAEVDVILERDGRFYPIEVKLTTKPTKADARGILAFRDAHPKLNIAQGLVISPTKQLQQLSNTDYALPWDSL